MRKRGSGISIGLPEGIPGNGFSYFLKKPKSDVILRLSPSIVSPVSLTMRIPLMGGISFSYNA